MNRQKQMRLLSFLTVAVMAAFYFPVEAAGKYEAFMWVGASPYKNPGKVPLFFERMREMGVTGVTVGNAENPERAVTNGFSFYVENVVNRGLCLKFHSKAADWEKMVTTWNLSRRPENAFIRDYVLNDPKWLAWGKNQIAESVHAVKNARPKYYDIRDEISVTISANPFDYDFSPQSLEGFRDWLKLRYPSLEALNATWETGFKAWGEVRPFTTDQIKNRMASGESIPRGNPDWGALQRLKFVPSEALKEPTRWNFAPWCDFRSYMDDALANALAYFRSEFKKLEPETPVGIEGTQMPSAWGGYDLWKLSKVLDWVEPYDIGSAREIFGSFMAGKPVMTTVFENETNPASRRLWHLLLEGDRGCIIWWSEDAVDWSHADYPLTTKAKALAPVLNEMKSDLAARFMEARRIKDPIAIHYSQPSIQVDWLLESTVDGSSWFRRFSSYEASHNRMARVRESWLKVLQDLGYSPVFVSGEQIEKGELDQFKVLVLPQSYALSDKEMEAIRKFRSRNSTVVFADGTPGLFDEHGKLRPAEKLISETGLRSSQEQCIALSQDKVSTLAADIAEYSKERLAENPKQEFPLWVKAQMPFNAPVELPLDARVRVHRFAESQESLIALERNISWQMSEELKQAGGNQALEKPVTIQVKTGGNTKFIDLRSGKETGSGGRAEITLDPWTPALLKIQN